MARALLGPGLAENVGHPGTDVQLVGLPIGFPGQKCAFSFKVKNHGPTYIKLLKLGQNWCKWPTTIGSGWWFGTFFYLSILGISSSQLTFTAWFFRGVAKNHQPDTYIYIHIYIIYIIYIPPDNPLLTIINHCFPTSCGSNKKTSPIVVWPATPRNDLKAPFHPAHPDVDVVAPFMSKLGSK